MSDRRSHAPSDGSRGTRDGFVTPGERERAAIRTLRLDLATVEVVEALRAEGIEAILLKGPVMARWLYDADWERDYVDCDLLVAPSTLARAEAILKARGFAREGFEAIEGDWPKHALVLRRRRDGVAMDIHRTFVGVGAPDEQLWSILSGRTEEIELAGSLVRALSPAGRAFTLVLHAAKDGGRVAKVRVDLEQAIDRLPMESWREAADLARRLDASTMFAWGLRRVPKGEAIARDLGLPQEMPVGFALRSQGAPPPLATGLEWMLRTPGWRGKFLVAMRKAIPPVTFMRAWSPMARRGRVGLVLAYLWRPLWILGRSVPAGIAVARARRLARTSSDMDEGVKG